ncbi:hypothetical protein C5S42_09830 [Candidatus Methanomarinus sp.]|nr:hypothetical protein C5S42_09830 [ANME-2 cluster archaeon]
MTDITPPHIKLDECNHVEKPLLTQFDGAGWGITRLTQDLLTGKKHVTTLLNETEVASL